MEQSSPQPNSVTPPQEGFRDERIIKLKEQANREYKEMKLQIANIEEMIKMFQDAVLAFNCTSLRYAEVLSQLLAETETIEKPKF